MASSLAVIHDDLADLLELMGGPNPDSPNLIPETDPWQFVTDLGASGLSPAAQIDQHDPAQNPWIAERRPNQTPPEGIWKTWLIMAGRGFGKTRTGAEWVREQVMFHRKRYVGIVGPTFDDVRFTMIEGESGILACLDRVGYVRDRDYFYYPSNLRIVFADGRFIRGYSAEKPDRLRGRQHDAAWADEIAAWAKGQEAWDMLQFGLRLGDDPRQVVTTTPKPVPVVKYILADRIGAENPQGTVAVSTGSTYDNADNLAASALEEWTKRYEGTRLGRQELQGELLTDTPGALWSLAMIEATRVRSAPQFLRRIVIGVDPMTGQPDESRDPNAPGSETGIVGCGLGFDSRGYILEDASLAGTPLEWARAVVALYDKLGADRVIAEANNGGLMVEATLRQIRPSLPITLVHASKGKIPRAEPVSALFEKGEVSHVGTFPRLEDQMTSYDGSGDSPDRMDAMVWAMTELMVEDDRTVRTRNYLGSGKGEDEADTERRRRAA